MQSPFTCVHIYMQAYCTYIGPRVKLAQFLPVVFHARLLLMSVGDEYAHTKDVNWPCVRKQVIVK